MNIQKLTCPTCRYNYEIDVDVYAKIRCKKCGSIIKYAGPSRKALMNELDEASKLRNRGSFKEASEKYIVLKSRYPTEAEVYWGLLLCEYGIRFVEDPTDPDRRIPYFCNQLPDGAMTSNSNYLDFYKYADESERGIYQSQIERYEALRSRIKELEKKEAYDVFISFKVKDARGYFTADSKIAKNIYEILTSSGYKVFYSPESLKGMMGEEYEPYIYVALKQARIMVLIGTQPEYVKAPWVQTEWSRFQNWMKQDRKKRLIPCYSHDALNDFPKGIGGGILQGVNINDEHVNERVLDVVMKLLPHKSMNESNEVQPRSSVPSSTRQENDAELVEKGYVQLSYGKMEEAKHYFQQALEINYKNSDAYIGKLLIELGLRTTNELHGCDKELQGCPDFVNAYKFATAEQKKAYDDILEARKANADMMAALDEGFFEIEANDRLKQKQEKKRLAQQALKDGNDPQKILSACMEAANCGDAEMQYNLGVIYYKGEITTKDYEKAFRLFKKSSAQDFALAQDWLGWCYEHGYGCRKNINFARDLYAKAGNAGVAKAAFSVGRLYEKYRFGKKKSEAYIEAANWYRKAADADYAPAKRNLGLLYYHGKGLIKNFDEAFKWLCAAAKQKDGEALGWLSVCYDNGHGCEINEQSASKCRKFAKKYGCRYWRIFLKRHKSYIRIMVIACFVSALWAIGISMYFAITMDIPFWDGRLVYGLRLTKIIKIIMPDKQYSENLSEMLNKLYSEEYSDALREMYVVETLDFIEELREDGKEELADSLEDTLKEVTT